MERVHRGRQRHEDVVCADLVEQASRGQGVAQVLLDPGHRENDSAPRQFGTQLVQRLEGGASTMESATAPSTPSAPAWLFRQSARECFGRR